MKNLLLLSLLLFSIAVKFIKLIDGTIIVLHNNISFTSTGTANTVQTQTLINGSLTELINFYEDYNNNSNNNNRNNSNSGVVSFLQQPFNFVLGEYFPYHNFQRFNLDYPIVSKHSI